MLRELNDLRSVGKVLALVPAEGDQVDGVDPIERCFEADGVGQVAGEHLDPFREAGPGGVAREGPDSVAGFEQLSDKAPPYMAGGSRDKDVHGGEFISGDLRVDFMLAAPEDKWRPHY